MVGNGALVETEMMALMATVSVVAKVKKDNYGYGTCGGVRGKEGK